MLLQEGGVDTVFYMYDGIDVYDITPVLPVSDFDEGGGMGANVVLVDGVVLDEVVEDEFF